MRSIAASKARKEHGVMYLGKPFFWKGHLQLFHAHLKFHKRNIFGMLIPVKEMVLQFSLRMGLLMKYSKIYSAMELMYPC